MFHKPRARAPTHHLPDEPTPPAEAARAPGVEPTNNRAERAFRERVVQRRMMGCFRNGKGTWICETVTTMLAAWKQQGRGLPPNLGQGPDPRMDEELNTTKNVIYRGGIVRRIR